MLQIQVFASHRTMKAIFTLQKIFAHQKINLYQIRELSMSIPNFQENRIILGYYPLRGKCQVCRLLCEYLNLPYANLFFTPQTWKIYKKEQTKNWQFAQLPFLQDGDFLVTEPYPIAIYLAKKAKREDILGKTLMDRIKIETYIWQNDIVKMTLAKIITWKDLTEAEIYRSLAEFFQGTVKQKLQALEDESKDGFFFGYVSLLDFYIYEVIYFFTPSTAQGLKPFKKLNAIYKNIAKISEIEAYENSKRAMTDICPLKFCEKWREKCTKSSHRQC